MSVGCVERKRSNHVNGEMGRKLVLRCATRFYFTLRYCVCVATVASSFLSVCLCMYVCECARAREVLCFRRLSYCLWHSTLVWGSREIVPWNFLRPTLAPVIVLSAKLLSLAKEMVDLTGTLLYISDANRKADARANERLAHSLEEDAHHFQRWSTMYRSWRMRINWE